MKYLTFIHSSVLYAMRRFYSSILKEVQKEKQQKFYSFFLYREFCFKKKKLLSNLYSIPFKIYPIKIHLVKMSELHSHLFYVTVYTFH